LVYSQEIWGGKSRLGDPTDEAYRSEFDRQPIEVFDLTKLKSPGGDLHDRAFEDITSVMAMIRCPATAGSRDDSRAKRTDISLAYICPILPKQVDRTS